MEITPAASVIQGDREPCVKVFGGKFPDLAGFNMVKHNIAVQPVMKNAYSSVATARIDYLEVNVLPCPWLEDLNVNIYFGWGHSEHSTPSDVEQLAQLPCFAFTSFGRGDKSGVSDRKLVCEFNASISRHLKPVMLEGGRPSLYAYAKAYDSDGKEWKKPVAELFFRVRLVTSGFDIVFA